MQTDQLEDLPFAPWPSPRMLLLLGSEKRSRLRYQFIMLLHAHICMEEERKGDGKCTLPYCATMKNLIEHMNSCEEGETCAVPYCCTSKIIILHWKHCTHSPGCPLCPHIINYIPEFSSSVRELVALVSESEDKLESQKLVFLMDSMFSDVNSQSADSGSQLNVDKHRTPAQRTQIPSITTSIADSAIRNVDSVEDNSSFGGTLVQNSASSHVQSTSSSLHTNQRGPLRMLRLPSSRMLSLLNPKEISLNSKENSLIAHLFAVLLHAHRCMRKERKGSRRKGNSQCVFPYCGTAKNLIEHMNSCEEGATCTVPYCCTSKLTVLHWKRCTNTKCPLLCLRKDEILKYHSNSLSELVALASRSEKKLELQNQMYGDAKNRIAVRGSQSIADRLRRRRQIIIVPSFTTSVTAPATRNVDSVEENSSFGGTLVQNSASSHVQSTYSSLHTNQRVPLNFVPWPFPRILSLLNSKEMSLNSEETSLIGQQFVVLLHAHRCMEKERNGSRQCMLPYCGTMKNLIEHMNSCEEGVTCAVPYCCTSKLMALHWKRCTNTECPLCLHYNRIAKDHYSGFSELIALASGSENKLELQSERFVMNSMFSDTNNQSAVNGSPLNMNEQRTSAQTDLSHSQTLQSLKLPSQPSSHATAPQQSPSNLEENLLPPRKEISPSKTLESSKILQQPESLQIENSVSTGSTHVFPLSTHTAGHSDTSSKTIVDEVTPQFGSDAPNATKSEQSHVKKWREQINVDLRNHLVNRFATLRVNPDDKCGIESSLESSRKIERDIYEAANSKNEYYHLMADKYFEIRRDVDEQDIEVISRSS